MSGRSPLRGSGLRPFGAEPQDASQAKPLVPNAVDAIQRFLERRSGVQVRIDDSCTHDWQSLTFRGQRATAQMWADDTASALSPILIALYDAEFDLPDTIIADVEVTRPAEDVPTWGGCTFTVEVLSIDDGAASAMSARMGQDNADWLEAKPASAGPQDDAQPSGSPTPILPKKERTK